MKMLFYIALVIVLIPLSFVQWDGEACTVQKESDVHNLFSKESQKYYIKNEIDLQGEEVIIAPDCELVFKRTGRLLSKPNPTYTTARSFFQDVKEFFLKAEQSIVANGFQLW